MFSLHLLREGSAVSLKKAQELLNVECSAIHKGTIGVQYCSFARHMI